MGLFGGSTSTSTSKTTRPGYVMDLVNSLNDQLGNVQEGEYTPQQFANLNPQQQQALASLLNSDTVNNYAKQLISQGGEGLNQINNVYSQLNNLQDVTPEDISRVANQFYDQEGVSNLIQQQNKQLENQYSTSTVPQLAEQTMQQSGFGSGQRVMRDRAAADLVTNQQNAASDITNAAYLNARTEAQNLLSGNLANRRNILGSLASNAQNQINGVNQAASLTNNQYQNIMNAIQQQQGNRQNQQDIDYQNQMNAQNWQTNYLNQKLGLVGGLSDQYGMTTTTKTKTGSNLLGGVLSTAGTVAGAYFGGPAGAMIGSQLGSIAGSAIAG